MRPPLRQRGCTCPHACSRLVKTPLSGSFGFWTSSLGVPHNYGLPLADVISVGCCQMQSTFFREDALLLRRKILRTNEHAIRARSTFTGCNQFPRCLDLMSSSAPSIQVRESARCSQLLNSKNANSPPWAENHDFLEKATITWLASSNWSVAHLALSAAIFFKLARHSRRQGSLRRSRRRPGPTALRGPWRLLRIGAFACLRASEAKPLKAMVCTSLRQESRGVSAVNSAAFWL